MTTTTKMSGAHPSLLYLPLDVMTSIFLSPTIILTSTLMYKRNTHTQTHTHTHTTYIQTDTYTTVSRNPRQ